MNILVFQHVDCEHPGVFRDFWDEAGHGWTPVELDAGEPIPPLEPFDILVAMGGPMDVWQEREHPWLVPEKEAIRRWVAELGRPFLGICLGHQLLAEALGGAVGPMKAPEVGIAEVKLTPAGRKDPVMAGFPPVTETFQWHGAEVKRLPKGAQTLAGNSKSKVQAMRWGACAYGTQFHCELTEATVGEWQEIPEYMASLEACLGKEGAARLGPAVEAKLADFNASARRLNDNFLAIAAARTGTKKPTSQRK